MKGSVAKANPTSRNAIAQQVHDVGSVNREPLRIVRIFRFKEVFCFKAGYLTALSRAAVPRWVREDELYVAERHARHDVDREPAGRGASFQRLQDGTGIGLGHLRPSGIRSRSARPSFD